MPNGRPRRPLAAGFPLVTHREFPFPHVIPDKRMFRRPRYRGKKYEGGFSPLGLTRSSAARMTAHYGHPCDSRNVAPATATAENRPLPAISLQYRG